MASQSENAYWPKEGAPTPGTTQPKQKYSEVGEVLETMKNLIIEIQSFKQDNEKKKRDIEKNQEIN